MRKIKSLIPLIALLIFIAAAEHPAAQADKSEQAQALMNDGQYEQAESLYKQVLEGNPGSEKALDAQKKLVLIYIATNRQTQAEAACQQLITDFSEHEGVVEAIWKIARGFNTARNKEKAIELHQYNVANFSDNKYAMWSQVEIVQSHIKDGNDIAADAAYEKLLTEFSSQPTLPKEIYHIAKQYSQAGKEDKAIKLYKLNADKDTSDTYAMWSQVEVIKSYIRNGNDAVDATTDELINKFSNQPTLPQQIHQIARQFSQNTQEDKATKLDKYLIEKFPSSMYASLSQVHCYIKDRNFDAADAAVDKILNDFTEEPTLPKEIYQLTGVYNKAKRYDKSARLYQYFLDKWPKAKQALEARKGLANCYINLKDEQKAHESIDKLLTDFTDHDGIAKAAYDLGQCYRQLKKHNKAVKLYQYAAENFSKDDKYTMWSQVEMVKYHIRDGNEPAAEAAYNKLISDFSNQPALATSVSQIGDTYCTAGNYNKADELNQYVFEHWPEDKQLLWAKAGKASLDIAQGNDDKANKAIDNLIAEYKDDPDLPKAIFLIGEQSWVQALTERRKSNPKPDPNNRKPPDIRPVLNEKAKDYFTKAQGIWEKIINELPSSSTTAQSYHMVAECHRILNQNQQAIECYQAVVNNWPDYQAAFHCQYMTGRIYKDLKRADAIPESDANLLIKDAYERLVAKYPDCPPAGAALRWLDDYKEMIRQRELSKSSASQLFKEYKGTENQGGRK